MQTSGRAPEAFVMTLAYLRAKCSSCHNKPYTTERLCSSNHRKLSYHQKCASIMSAGVGNATVLSRIKWLEQTTCPVQLMEDILCKTSQLSHLVAEHSQMCSATVSQAFLILMGVFS